MGLVRVEGKYIIAGEGKVKVEEKFDWARRGAEELTRSFRKCLVEKNPRLYIFILNFIIIKIGKN